MMDGLDEVIYGDKSVHRVIRHAFSNSWEMVPKIYQLKFNLRHLKPMIRSSSVGLT